MSLNSFWTVSLEATLVATYLENICQNVISLVLTILCVITTSLLWFRLYTPLSSTCHPGPFEFAGTATVADPQDHSFSVETSQQWVADTGATSHMTPHRHWFNTYTPHRVAIKLADGKIVYSQGIGSVIVESEGENLPHRSLEFFNVLHVPLLTSNLLAVLYLARHKAFKVIITEDKMHFNRSGRLLFTATVTSNSAAYVDGNTKLPEAAHIAVTRPLDISLWC